MTKLTFSSILLGCCLAFTAQAQENASKPKPQVTLVTQGMQAPDFKYETVKGKYQKISDLKGKLVLINFFATWCGPCKAELPKIQSEIWDKNKENQKFVMLTFGREHTWAEVDKFKKDNQFRFPFYPDPKRAIFDQFATQNIPRSFLLDEDGKVIFTSEGFNETQFGELVKLIDSRLHP